MRISGLDADLDILKLNVRLKLADVDNGLEFRQRSKLIDPPPEAGG